MDVVRDPPTGRAQYDLLPRREVEICEGVTITRRLDPEKLINSLSKRRIPRVKITILGDCDVGKSRLVGWWTENNASKRGGSTVGVESHVITKKTDNCEEVKVTLWDTSGSKKYFEIRNEFYKEPDAVCAFCFSTTSRVSFSSISNWLREVRQQSPSTKRGFLIGLHSGRPQVPTEEATNFANANTLTYYECNPSTGENCSAVFDAIIPHCATRVAVN